MIRKATQIEQPYYGEYEERIYDIESPWNSSDWTWIVIEEDDSVWCGEFRGKYRGTAISETIGITIVLTSDYLYVLDNSNAEIIEYKRSPQYNQVSCTPYGDILLADYYGLDVLRERELKSIDSIILPINADEIKLVRYEGKYLVMESTEICNWEKTYILKLDCESLEIIECY